ncbi:MAG: UPF0182 family protein [Actinobacteria bacterium]|nr:UPF0182 family protein [Actinomycetota bacterium]
MRPPPDQPPRPPGPERPRRIHPPTGRGRVLLIVAAVVVFFLVTSLRGIASFYTEYLWYDSINLTGVWRGVLGAKIALALIFGAVFFGLVWVNLVLADRVAPAFRFGAGEDGFVERYQELVGRRVGTLRVVVSLVLAFAAGSAASGRWNDWVLFTNRVSFGTKDATYGKDIGFYVFTLPFVKFVAGWLFSTLIVVLIASAAAHYLNGGIRAQAGSRTTPQVKAHLSVLLGVLSLIRAGQYWIDRYELVFSQQGFVDGATYTDVNVRQKSLSLLMIISVTAFVLFLVNIRRRGWVLPVIAVGMWVLVQVLAGGAVPAYVQWAKVRPDESAKEAPYIRNNVAATRAALGLTKVTSRRFAADGKLTGAQLNANADTVQNIRIWDPARLQETFQKLQGLRDFYQVPDVDVDRYKIDGQLRQVMIAARELNRSGIPQQTWEASRLRFTQGYGAIMAPSNAKGADGSPVLYMSDIPVSSTNGAPKVDQPSIYIGEAQSGYVIVDARSQEILYQDKGGRTVYRSYKGRDGVRLSGLLRRAAFALRFGDPNPVLSDSIRPSSKILLHRDLQDRLRTVAPFLSFDADPYLTVVGGRLRYIVDGYTTTDRYPNAQIADTSDLPSGSGLRRRLNYVRNSVKAVIDAYDGTVTLYVVDSSDPLIRAYRKAFPELFSSVSEAPAELRAHFRYPEDLFRVQTAMWGRYHVTDPATFYSGNDQWNVSSDPGAQTVNTGVGAGSVVSTPTTGSQSSQGTASGNRIDPTYLLMKVPGDKQESFLALRPFTPASRTNATGLLTSFMVAKSDGSLEQFTMPPSNLPSGPTIAAANMSQDEKVAQLQTLLGQTGSELTYGNVLLIPIEQSLLYIRPVYVTADQDPKVPLVKRVIVAFQTPTDTKIAVEPTLDAALVDIFKTSPGTLEEPTGGSTGGGTGGGTGSGGATGGGTTGPTAAERDRLVRELNAAFDRADKAIRAGDTEGWARAVKEAERISRRLTTSSSSSGSGSTSGSTSTTTTPSNSGGSAGTSSTTTTTTTTTTTSRGATTSTTTA